VIIGTGHRIAVALEYDGQNAPTVTAKGVNDVADRIVETAIEYGVPLQRNDGLVGILAKLELGDEIPENLYRAVAEVIAFAYLVRAQM